MGSACGSVLSLRSGAASWGTRSSTPAAHRPQTGRQTLKSDWRAAAPLSPRLITPPPGGRAALEVGLARRRADLLEAHHAVHGGDEIHLLLVEAHVAHGAGGVRGQAVLLAEAAHRAPDARPAQIGRAHAS